jgi:hypothetical protein
MTDVRQKTNRNPLYLPSCVGNLLIVQLVLMNRADKLSFSLMNVTSLHIVWFWGHFDVVRFHFLPTKEQTRKRPIMFDDTFFDTCRLKQGHCETRVCFFIDNQLCVRVGVYHVENEKKDRMDYLSHQQLARCQPMCWYRHRCYYCLRSCISTKNIPHPEENYCPFVVFRKKLEKHYNKAVKY